MDHGEELTAADKGYWEAYKMRAEALAAARSPAKSPAFWVPWITAAVAVGGFVLNYQSASIQTQKAALELAQARHDQEDISEQITAGNAQLKELQDTKNGLTADLQQILAERAQAESALDEARTALAALKSSPTDTVSVAGAAKIEAINKQLNNASVIQQKLNVRAEDTLKKLDAAKVPVIQRTGAGRTTQGAQSMKE